MEFWPPLSAVFAPRPLIFCHQKGKLNYSENIFPGFVTNLLKLRLLYKIYRRCKKRRCTKRKSFMLAGFTVLRFTDEEVLNNLAQVREKIEKVD
jgi:hypothetical protein